MITSPERANLFYSIISNFGTALCLNRWMINPGQSLSVLQGIWPERQGRYPEDPQVDKEIRKQQRLLVEERPDRKSIGSSRGDYRL